MRLISRQRSHRRSQAPRVSISQAEITADLDYPASRRPRRRSGPAPARGAGR